MALITRNVAKGVAPRVHEPRAKAKPHTKKNNTKSKPKPKASRKRAATSDQESEEEEGDLSDSSIVKPKKKKSKQQHMEESSSEEEVETVDQDIGPSAKETEEVEDGTGERGLDNEQEVSTHQSGLAYCGETYHNLGRWFE